jgi:hypothetical protein
MKLRLSLLQGFRRGWKFREIFTKSGIAVSQAELEPCRAGNEWISRPEDVRGIMESRVEIVWNYVTREGDLRDVRWSPRRQNGY